MSDTDGGDLTDFGGGVEHHPPRVRREYIMQSNVTGRLCGFLGVETNTGRRVYTTRRTDFHFYYEGEGYAISDSILDRLEENGNIVRIIIHEKDEHDVYEFDARTYFEHGAPVHENDLWREDDPQTYAELDLAEHTWEDHAPALFEHPFGHATERINWRGYSPEKKRRLAEDGDD